MLDKDPHQIQRMFASVSHRYDLANRVLSMRFDVAWRKKVARELLTRPGRVLDLAAGTGDLTIDLHRVGGHSVVAADFTFEMLTCGRAKLRESAPASAQVTADALALPFHTGVFDGVSVAFGVRNFLDPVEGLREIRRVLRPGGRGGVLEFSRPSQPIRFFYEIYSLHVLPLVGGLITGARSPYEYLPKSVQAFPEGKAFLELMESAGFRNLTATRLSGGIVTFYRGDA